MQIAFYAYPAGHQSVRDAVDGVVESSGGLNLTIRPWEKMEIVGLKVDNLIRDEIRNAALLIADVTYPNFNVYYELGFAIALGKGIIPTVNTSIAGSTRRIVEIGLFDTIGWAAYANSQELLFKLKDRSDFLWTAKYVKKKNHAQPLFLLDCLQKTDFRNHIISAIENSQVKRRAFDPSEVPRLTAMQAISEVSSSAGVILPILSQEIEDSQRHNLRAAFLLGLCHGFELEALAIQYENVPAPLDYRDFITNSTFKRETFNHVESYCSETLVKNQEVYAGSNRGEYGLIGQIDLGSTVAEYENLHLDEYFVQTAEFARAIRAEGAVITGRKGSGKSAVYLQAVKKFRRNRKCCVVDLRPASHSLSEMRAALLKVVAVGVFEHTIAAFWQFITLTEIILKIREYLLPKSKNDFALQERIRAVETSCGFGEAIVSGDFTSRLGDVIHDVVTLIHNYDSEGDVKTQITNFVFERPIPKLRDAISSFHDYVEEIIVLIDDLDKGWPPLQVEPHDVLTIRHLVEVLNRIQRDLTKRNIHFRHIVFLRTDVYELLVAETSDRGKYNLIRIEWSDVKQLSNLLRQRIINNLDPVHYDNVWKAVNPGMNDGIEAVDFMISSSLMRPRFLIDLMERTLSCAVNRGHKTVMVEDVRESARQMSLYLVSDFAYEMRDIAGTPEDIFYAFIGAPGFLCENDLQVILESVDCPVSNARIIELLLWYGFLGIARDGSAIYIYDRAYDFRRLEAERKAMKGEVRYAINPAFLLGLDR